MDRLSVVRVGLRKPSRLPKWAVNSSTRRFVLFSSRLTSTSFVDGLSCKKTTRSFTTVAPRAPAAYTLRHLRS